MEDAPGPPSGEALRMVEVRSRQDPTVVGPGFHRAAGGNGRVTVATLPAEEGMGEDQVLHLVQDEETVAELHQCVLPPDGYYDRLP